MSIIKHLQSNKHDTVSINGLQKIIAKRRRLIRYLKNH